MTSGTVMSPATLEGAIEMLHFFHKDCPPAQLPPPCHCPSKTPHRLLAMALRVEEQWLQKDVPDPVTWPGVMVVDVIWECSSNCHTLLIVLIYNCQSICTYAYVLYDMHCDVITGKVVHSVYLTYMHRSYMTCWIPSFSRKACRLIRPWNLQESFVDRLDPTTS